MKKIISVICVLCIAATANAKSIVIGFDDMMAQSKSIVIGTYLGEYVTGKIFHIEVDSVVKGEKRSGIITVNKAKGIPRLIPGTKVMAFINPQNEWEWYGTSDNFRAGIIYLQGFNDYNSYEVYPSAVSLEQLNAFMRTGEYSGVVEGNLRFWSFDKNKFEKSATYFAVLYTYHGNDSTNTRYLAGGLNTGNFPPTPRITFTGATIVFTYDDNPDRPLQIGGHMDSLKKGNEFVASFEVWQPMNMTTEQFDQYVGNDKLGPLCYNLSVLLNSRPGEAVVGVSAFPFVYGEEQGDIGYIMFGERRIDCVQFALPTNDQTGLMKFGTWTQPEVEIVLNEIPASIDYDEIRTMHGLRLINTLRTTQLTGEMFVYENGVRVSRGTCEIILEGTRFTEIPDNN